MDGKVAVVCPNPSLRYCRYFDSQTRSTYPLFSKVGTGFGGMENKGAQGINVIKATAYPGRYVHHMKAWACQRKLPQGNVSPNGLVCNGYAEGSFDVKGARTCELPVMISSD